MLNGRAKGVALARIDQDQSPFRRAYEPSNPAADAQGYVKMPNVDPLVETLDMREAQRAYQANISVIETARKPTVVSLSKRSLAEIHVLPDARFRETIRDVFLRLPFEVQGRISIWTDAGERRGHRRTADLPKGSRVWVAVIGDDRYRPGLSRSTLRNLWRIFHYIIHCL